jgi:hypothetical protein
MLRNIEILQAVASVIWGVGFWIPKTNFISNCVIQNMTSSIVAWESS